MAYRRVRVPEEIERIMAGLHPETKRKVRAAVDAIADDPSVGLPLERELTGYRKVTLGSWRIVYRQRRGIVEMHAVGRRATVYSDLIRRLRRSVRQAR